MLFSFFLIKAFLVVIRTTFKVVSKNCHSVEKNWLSRAYEINGIIM